MMAKRVEYAAAAASRERAVMMEEAGVPAFLPYGRQAIDEDDIAAVAEALRGDLLTTGPTVAAFERDLGDAVGAEFAVVCSNGTAALHLAALALGLGPRDAVIVPAITFLATANMARYVGAEVVFADVDPATGLMGAAEAEAALARVPNALAARAVAPVHLAGQCADPTGIRALAERHGLHVIEDACHALGSTYDNGTAVGAAAHADLAVFSFHPVKTIAMGEGGAITGNDPALGDRLRRLRGHGMTRAAADFVHSDLARSADAAVNPWYYEMHELGLNYRASDILCALGRSQLSKLGRFVERRRALAERYDQLLAPLAPTVQPLGRVPGQRPAWHLYVVLIDFDAAGRDRATVMRTLAERGIGSQVHYIPVHWQPYYRDRYGAVDLPGAATYYRRCLSLPLYPGLADTDVDRVVSALATSLGDRM